MAGDTPSSSTVSITGGGGGEAGVADRGGEAIGELGAGVGVAGAGVGVVVDGVAVVTGEATAGVGVSSDIAVGVVPSARADVAGGVEGVGVVGLGVGVVGVVGVPGAPAGGGVVVVGSVPSVFAFLASGSLAAACSLLRLRLASAILAASTPTKAGN